MDKSTQNPLRYDFEKALEQLRLLGFRVSTKKDVRLSNERRADAELTIRFGGSTFSCIAETKRNLRPSAIGSVLHQLHSMGEQAILIADYVSQSMAEKLRAEKVWFADTAGNAYIDNPPIYIWVTGKSRPKGHPATETLRSFQPSGLKIIFALLSRPNLVNSPYRKIAELSGVSHGSVGWVMAELPKLGFLVEYKSKRSLLKHDTLVEQWAENYSRTLRPRLQMASYSCPDIQWWRKERFQDFDYELSGEAAAAEITANFRPASLTLYGKRISKPFIRKYRLRSDAEPNIEIMEKFWDFSEENIRLVPPLLIFADLLSTSEARCVELAGEFRKEYLRGPE